MATVRLREVRHSIYSRQLQHSHRGL